MGIIREISPELDPVEFPDSMSPSDVDAYLAQNGAKIRNRLIARRMAQLEGETRGEEELKYRSGEVPFGERVGSTVMSAFQSGTRQVGQTLRGLGSRMTTMQIPTDEFGFDEAVAAENRRRLERTPEQIQSETEAFPVTQAGQKLVDKSTETFPTLPGVEESIPSQVASGVGSVGALIPAAVTGPAAPFVAGGMYGLSAGEESFQEAGQVIDRRIAEAMARGDTATAADLERRKFDLQQKARTASEVIGGVSQGLLGVASKIRVGKSSIGGIGEKIAEKLVPTRAPVRVQEAVRGAVEGLATEAAQESSEQLLGNAAAKAVYDPSRGLMDGVVESAVVGGLTGKLVGGAVGSRGRERDPMPMARQAAEQKIVEDISQQEQEIRDLTLEDAADILAGVPETAPVAETLVEPVPEPAPEPAAPVAEPVAVVETPVEVAPEPVAAVETVAAAPEPAPVEKPKPEQKPVESAKISEPKKIAAPELTEELVGKAEQAVRSEKRATISFLQRKLRIGYNLASRVMQELEGRGVVGPSNNQGQRQILETEPQSEALPEPAPQPAPEAAPAQALPTATPAATPATDTALTEAIDTTPVTSPVDQAILGAAPLAQTEDTAGVETPVDAAMRGATQPTQPNPEPDPQSLTPKQYHKAINKWRSQEYGVPVSEVDEQYPEQTNTQDHWRAIIAFADRGGKLTDKILDSLSEEQIQYLERSARASIPEGYLSPAVRAKNKAFEREMIDARNRGREAAKAKPGSSTPIIGEQQPAPEAPPPAQPKSVQQYNAIVDQITALGPRPNKPSTELRRFGRRGKAAASPEARTAWENEVKAYQSWVRKYSALVKKRQAAQDAVLAEDPEYFKRQTEPKPDRIESALDAAIKATDTRGRTFNDPFLIATVGLPVLNAALRLARRVYLRTRDMARARRQGIRLIRRRQRTIPPADLPEVERRFNNLVENGVSEGPPPDAVTAIAPSDGSQRRQSRGLFRGEVTVNSDEEWQRNAVTWIEQFNGNIRRAFEAARSTDFATTGLDPASQLYVFTRLLEMSETAVNAARNDVDQMRYLNLQAEIAESIRQVNAESGKSLSAANLTQNRITWMMPVLTFRNLVREAQRRIPFTNVVAEEVRTWLTEAGRRAIQEMRNAMSDADNVFARELGTAVRDMRVVWRDVMTSSLDAQEGMRRRILQQLVAAPELQGLSRQGYIDIANLLARAWERERARIFRQEFRKQVPLPGVREDTRRRIFESIPDILRWANLGLLDNEAFRNAVAPQFGVARFDGPTAQRLNQMAQEAQRVDGSNRNRILQEMYQLMQREGGVRFWDVIRDYWYASVLSGIRTQVDNGLSIINGALTTAMGMAMAQPEVRRIMGRAYTQGFGEAISDFWPILWRGDLWRSVNFNPDQPQNVLEAMARSRNLFARAIGLGRYVSRLMVAIDHVNALSTDQAMKAWAIGRRFPIEHVQRYLTPSDRVIAAAREQAVNEGTPPNLVAKRTREIIQEGIPVEALISARDLRQIVTFTNQPRGVAGALYRGLNDMEKRFPGFKVLSGTNFMRFAGNATNELLNYVAPVALFRYWNSSSARQAADSGLNIGEEERMLILAKAALGTALGTFAAALFLGDDDDEEDRDIDITGSFKSLDPNKRKQLMSEGRQPYSIRFGNTYVSYRQLPFGGVLGAIGELRDRQLFNREEWDQETIIRKFADGALAGTLIIRDSPAISSFTEFLGFANAYKYDMTDTVEKSTPKFLARLAGSLVPNIAKEIDAWSDPALYKANVGHEYFLQQMPYMRRELGAGPILNVLGEPVKIERYPWSRWIRERQDDKAWSTLGALASRGVFLPVPSVSVQVLENGKRRPMTPKEQHDYQKRVGAGYRKFVEENSAKLLKMKPDEAVEFIEDGTRKIRENSRLTKAY